MEIKGTHRHPPPLQSHKAQGKGKDTTCRGRSLSHANVPARGALTDEKAQGKGNRKQTCHTGLSCWTSTEPQSEPPTEHTSGPTASQRAWKQEPVLCEDQGGTGVGGEAHTQAHTQAGPTHTLPAVSTQSHTHSGHTSAHPSYTQASVPVITQLHAKPQHPHTLASGIKETHAQPGHTHMPGRQHRSELQAYMRRQRSERRGKQRCLARQVEEEEDRRKNRLQELNRRQRDTLKRHRRTAGIQSKATGNQVFFTQGKTNGLLYVCNLEC